MSSQRDGLLKRCECAPALWKKCDHGWHLKMRHDGQRYSISLDVYAKRRGLDRALLRGDAETLVERITKEIESGTYQDRPTPPSDLTASVNEGLTFDQAAGRFVVDVLNPEMVSLKDEQGRLRRLGEVVVEGVKLGDRAVGTIAKEHVKAAYAACTKGRADHTKRKYRRALKRLFGWCVVEGHLTVSPIATTVLHAGTGVMRTQRVNRDVEDNLIAAASEGRSDSALRLAAIIVAALDLGARVGELLALQWRDILWDFYRVSIRAVEAGARKNRKPRQVPLTPRVVEWLEKLQATAPTEQGWSGSDYVFGDATGGRVTKIRKAWVTCVLRAHNVQPAWTGTALAADVRARFEDIDLHFHDLRHECALRWHREKRYSLSTVANLLGHSNLDSLKVYLGVSQEEAVAEAERINAELAGEAKPVPDSARTGGTKTAPKPPTTVVPWRPRKGARKAVSG